MLLNGHGRSALEMTNGRPLCPQCRVPLWIVHIDEREADDRRAFVCPRCEHTHADRGVKRIQM
jgi:Zn-finger nucleic acid-binding protein